MQLLARTYRYSSDSDGGCGSGLWRVAVCLRALARVRVRALLALVPSSFFSRAPFVWSTLCVAHTTHTHTIARVLGV